MVVRNSSRRLLPDCCPQSGVPGFAKGGTSIGRDESADDPDVPFVGVADDEGSGAAFAIAASMAGKSEVRPPPFVANSASRWTLKIE
jgi:hypothetical protein